MDFVIDNSIVMSWAFDDECSEYGEAVLDSLRSSRAYVPQIWPLEVANVLVSAERRQRLTPKDSAQFVSLLKSLPIEVIHDHSKSEIRGLLETARKVGLSSYDASYLELCSSRGVPLATLDQDLKKAAMNVGVGIWLE